MKTSISDRTSPDSINDDRPVNPPAHGLGAWLFRHRTAIPVPVALAIVFLRWRQAPPLLVLTATGVFITFLGEILRLWGVHHIGAISRTRSDRLGPLVSSGPFGIVRNPLYVGNIAIWVGFALIARLLWLAPVIVVLLALEYHAIVRWEEQLLEARLGDAYRAYAARVPRWLPRLNGGVRSSPPPQAQESARAVILPDSGSPVFVSATSNEQKSRSWRATLFSERGTLLAIALGFFLLWIKARF
jgi:protein-S-isoprenylcysteine O-methyltransferase Ste14